MSLSSIINDAIEEKLLDTSTAFIGKVISFNQTKKTANVQPLTMTKAYGKEAKQRAVLTDIPVLNNAQYKIEWYKQPITCAECGTLIVLELPKKIFLQTGDLVMCVVSDRDISEALKGNSALPTLGDHDIQNAIVIGTL